MSVHFSFFFLSRLEKYEKVSANSRHLLNRYVNLLWIYSRKEMERARERERECERVIIAARGSASSLTLILKFTVYR